MSESILLIGFGVWLLYRTWKGYKQGFWVTVVSGVAVVLAYLISLFIGSDTAALVERVGVPSYLSLFVAYPVTFFVVCLVLNRLPFIFMPGLRTSSRRRAILGAAAGAVVGSLSGLIAVWFVNLLLSMHLLPQQDTSASDGQPLVSNDESDKHAVRAATVAPSVLTELATGLVSGTAGAVAVVAGAEESELVMMSAVMRDPGVVIGGMRDVIRSPEMRELMRSEKATSMMARNDANSLKNSETFSALVRQPAMQNMLSYLSTDNRPDSSNTGQADGELFIAEQLTFVWRRMAYLETDPRFVALMKDEELQNILQANNPIKLMTNAKFQRLATLILDGAAGVDEHQLSAVLMAKQNKVELAPQGITEPFKIDSASAEAAGPKPYAPQIVYKWQDDTGRWQYSDWDNIPNDKRRSAEKLRR